MADQRKIKKKKENPSISKIPLPAKAKQVETSQSFFQSLKALKSDRHLLLILAMIALPVGIASQLSWLKFRCIGEPFIGSVKATCKDNIWRMVFGGPLVFLVGYSIAAWMNSTTRALPRWRLLFPVACLLPTTVLPFIHNEQSHDRVITGIAIIFVCGLAFSGREKLGALISSLFARPDFRLRVETTASSIHVSLLGQLTTKEKDWILDSVLGALQENTTSPRDITVDFNGLAAFGSDFSWVIHLIHAFALYSNAQLTLNGPKPIVNVIANQLAQDTRQFNAGRKRQHDHK
jgi:hypothetical protein